MAKYTVELGTIHKSGLKIFDFPYTFYDEVEKPKFEQMFINHFFFREIGVETVGRFQHYLKCKCDETLPYYNMLLTTAKVEYDLLNNYNLTEIMVRTTDNTKDVTGSMEQIGASTKDADVVLSGEKTSALNSTTDHTEDIDFTRNNEIDETGTIDNTTTVDNKKVGSKTPNGLLTMADIKTNVYADQADIEDGSTIDNQDTTANRTEDLIENTDRTTQDIIVATNHDSSTDITDETIKETSNTNASTTQNEIVNGSENYTLTRVGNIGVDKPSDMLSKHVEFQKILTTAYTQFFNECEDLFMQIF